MTWTFALRSGVKFSSGQLMTSADVRFSLDQARRPAGAWSFVDTAIASVSAPSPETVVIKTKYPWAPLLADLALFDNGIIPANFAGRTRAAFYGQPVGTGPFLWDHWTKGSELKLTKDPTYWQPGRITWDNSTNISQGIQGITRSYPKPSTAQRRRVRKMSVPGASARCRRTPPRRARGL